VTDIKLQLDLI